MLLKKGDLIGLAAVRALTSRINVELMCLSRCFFRVRGKLNARKKTSTAVAHTDIRDREPSKEFIKLI